MLRLVWMVGPNR